MKSRFYFIIPILLLVAWAIAYALYSPPSRTPFNPEAPYANRNGALEAKADISNGVFIIYSYGLQVWDGSSAHIESILRDRYRISLRSFGCVVTDGMIEYTKSYNDVMIPHIESLYGKDLFERVEEEAKLDAMHEAKMRELNER